MKLNKATIEDFESIIAFYDDVTDRTADMAKYTRWQKEKHPTSDGIRAFIEEGSMYLSPFSLSITEHYYKSRNENEESTRRY